MWEMGGSSIVGYAYSESELETLLEKADKESLYSKNQAIKAGATLYDRVPSGYTVNDIGELEENWKFSDSDPY